MSPPQRLGSSKVVRGIDVKEEKIGRRVNITRVEQALPQQPKVIASACPYCATMMLDGVKHLGRDDEVAVRDIAELVADALVVDDSRPVERL